MKKPYHSPQLAQLPGCPDCASTREHLEEKLKEWERAAEGAENRAEFLYALMVRDHIQDIRTILMHLNPSAK